MTVLLEYIDLFYSDWQYKIVILTIWEGYPAFYQSIMLYFIFKSSLSFLEFASIIPAFHSACAFLFFLWQNQHTPVPVTVIWLGKSVDNKARPLLIVIDDLSRSHKEFIVFHSYYLRRHSQYKNVYISTDMIKLQHEKH